MNTFRFKLWILDGHEPVQVDNLVDWGEFMEDEKRRRVGFDTIEQPEHDRVTVSTVFLGMDHNWSGGEPLLFESMVFGGPLDGQQYRYTCWNAALAGHRMLIDEAVIEGKVAAWEVRERLARLALSPSQEGKE